MLKIFSHTGLILSKLARSMDRVDEAVINYDLIEDVLAALFLNSPCPFKLPHSDSSDEYQSQSIKSSGAVLVFMPGIGEIRTLADRLAGSRSFGDRDKFEVIPLHSTLTSTEQKRAFKASPKGCRKIIVSTNVAETSVTLPDVVYVLDCGRVREMYRDKRTGTRKLVATWCSRASAKQRAGRAGRVQAGVCLKLFSSGTEKRVMKPTSEPELRRIPLEEVCLTILAGGFAESCAAFISQTPQPPEEAAIRSAIQVLEDIGALDTLQPINGTTSSSGERLTALGRHLAKLPVDARVGKMLIFGALFQCTDSILTVAACLSASKSPFSSSFDNSEQVKASHAQFSHPFSDFITLINVLEAVRRAEETNSVRTLCRDKFLNYAAVREIQDARYHYLDHLCALGFVDRAALTDNSRKRSFDEAKLATSKYCRHSKLEQVVHSVICAGLNPNVASLTFAGPNGDLSIFHKTERLVIQSSVNAKLPRQVPSSWLTFFEKFGTEHKVTISKTAFVSPFCLMLFGSDFQVLHTERKVLVDGWILLPASAKTGGMFREIRNGLDDLLTSLIQDSYSSNAVASSVIDAIVRLLANG
jgi:ATP-dependent RNA helicase DHX29